MAKLHRYWIRFENGGPFDYNFLKLGCGITAWTEDDAIGLLRERVFEGDNLPEIREIVADIDIRELDADHVRPNIGAVSLRGVWFPHGGGP